MGEIIAEAECPACGDIMEFETLGEQLCPCGEMRGELTIDWKVTEERD